MKPPRMLRRLFQYLIVLSAASVAMPTFSQDSGPFSVGTYRVEGTCSRTFYLGVETLPQCDHFLGIRVTDPAKPLIIFPLKSGGLAWFFVTSKLVAASGNHAVYSVEKLYDQELNAEFPYPAGECEITDGPTVRCSVWKDAKRTVLARELVFSGSGNWMHAN